MNAMENGCDDDKNDVVIEQNNDNDGIRDDIGFHLKRGRLGDYDVCRTNRVLDDRVDGNDNGRVEFRGMRNGGSSTLPDFRTRKFKDIDVKLDSRFDSDDEEDGGYWMKVPSGDGRVSGDMGKRGKFDGNFEARVRTKEMPAVSEKKRGGGVKRGRSAVDEMVNLIKVLGEGFVKMERMKMEMAKETDQMRMEMELKRNELLLESQQQIVDAFVKGLFGKKVKTTVSPQL